MENNNIKNIIFDFGGVIININPANVGDSLAKMGVANVDKLHQKLIDEKVYLNLEIGAISPQNFRDAVKNYAGCGLTDTQVDKAWNSLILNIPSNRIEALKIAAANYRTFLLSNTNEIHYIYYNDYVRNTFGVESLRVFFEKAYFSHDMGMRKPSEEIFSVVLQENDLDPNETLFIDDSKGNLPPAEQLGIKTYLLPPEKELEELFDAGKLVV